MLFFAISPFCLKCLISAGWFDPERTNWRVQYSAFCSFGMILCRIWTCFLPIGWFSSNWAIVTKQEMPHNIDCLTFSKVDIYYEIKREEKKKKEYLWCTFNSHYRLYCVERTSIEYKISTFDRFGYCGLSIQSNKVLAKDSLCVVNIRNYETNESSRIAILKFLCTN